MPDVIASLRNPLIKEIRKAITRGTLTDDGCAVAESFHLLEEAMRSDCAIPAVVAAESVRDEVTRLVARLPGLRLSVLSDSVFQQIAATEASQGVIALVRFPVWTLDALFAGRTLVVALDGVQDPGNAGTIVRAAEAFGATGVLFLKGTVSPFNTKTLRASAGSLFRLPVVTGMDADSAQTTFQQRRLQIYAAMPEALHNLEQVDFTRCCALVIGSEGSGVSRTLRQGATPVSIPTTGVESLNAAVAASIILYEAGRQRRALETNS